MAMALRPRDSPTSIVSRYGSQALDDGLRPGRGVGGGATRPANSAPNSVITSLAGFAEGGSKMIWSAGFASESVITSLAGFADG